MIDRRLPASTSTTTTSILTRHGSFLDFPIMLLHLLLELLHLSAGKAAGGEGGQGLMDVDGEDLEHLLDIHAVFRREGLGVEGLLQLCCEVG